MSTNGCCEMNLRRMRTVLQHVIECKSGCACAQKSQKYGLQNQYSFSEMRLIILKCKANNGNLSGLLGFVYTSFTYNSQEKRMIGCLYRHRQRWWGYSRLLPFLTPVTGVDGSRLHKALEEFYSCRLVTRHFLARCTLRVELYLRTIRVFTEWQRRLPG